MGDGQLQMLITLLGLLGGIALGMAARAASFCTLGAMEEAYYGAERVRLRTWLLAIGIAIAVTQYMDFTGLVDLQRSWRLAGHIAIGGAIIGGLMFGLGMALVGTCAFGMLVRVGSGDMRALFSASVLGISAFVTMSGILAPVRLATVEQLVIELPPLTSQSLPALLFGDSVGGRAIIVLLLVAATAGWALTSRRFRRRNLHIFAALVMGLSISFGWLVTSTLGQDTLYPQQPDSYSFVRPIGQSMLWLMLASGSSAHFLIGGVFGVVIGSFIIAWWRGEVSWEAFDDAREMRRHLIGASLMGMGGIMAGGCTIGQGMTGVATLSVTAMLAIASIVIGALLGIRLLVEGNTGEIWQRALGFLRWRGSNGQDKNM